MTPHDLPAHLAERVRPVDAAATVPGDIVLYWMHHAVRADENPALDAAIAAAAGLGLALLVYQGLGGRHPYDSDRHHTFILEGARDAADDLAARGVRHVLHLPRGDAHGSPLRALAARAALVLTEDLPAPPLAAWTRALARRIDAPLWRVDTACVLPMRLVTRSYARAFEFRRAHGEEQLRRARASWPELSERAPAFDGDPGFEATDLAGAELASLVATCAVDHGVGPAPHTRGGARAGGARWNAFRADGLARYDRLRNDAAVAPRGVSRLSPYLHHGHVSPLRIAREAVAHDSEGAAKFLDELLVWRELAHNFCFHHEASDGGLESLARLPGWARETLAAHASDPRPALLERDRLERGATGDALWDAAQASLRVHGELHNNVRMTWGKAFLEWTASPELALERMLELNHRYALDGSDPNSYGGLLYCLGLFDRAFRPERAIAGAVRTRPTATHAQRLDLGAYAARASSRGDGAIRSVAVVGAGLSGLAAARALADQGFAVTVLERGRGPGGRAAHRRVEAHAFDHGAQYFTARDPRFVRRVERWCDAGVVARWDPRIEALGDRVGGASRDAGATVRYVGVPGMNAMAKQLAEGLDVITGCTVAAAHRDARGWRLDSDAERAAGPFDALVLAMPPEQSARLGGAAAAGLAARALGEAPTSLPCQAALAAFDAPLAADFDGVFVNGDAVDWAARDSSKPGRPPGERWIVHATPGWSAQRLDAPRADVAAALLDAFFAETGIAPRAPAFLAGHRWSLARPAGDWRVGCAWDVDDRIALCGDWCLGGRVEGAYLSGVAAAGRIAGAAQR